MIQEEIRLPVTSILLVEHRVLRELTQAMERALLANTPAEALRERAAMLEVALDRHAARDWPALPRCPSSPGSF